MLHRTAKKTAQARRSGIRFSTLRSSPVAAFLVIFFVSFLLAVFVLFMQRRWRARGQRAVVIVHNAVDEVRKPLTLAVIDPREPSLTLMSLPPEKPISPLLAYGAYPTQALASLTQLEDLRWEFLTGSLGLEYGVALDGILWTNQSEVRTRGDLRAVVLGAIANQVPTTLAYWDRWQLLSLLEGVPDYALDISFPGDAESADYEQWASRSIQDNALRTSAISVAVQNASGTQGLATRFSRMLRIMGYDVRNIETVEEQSLSRLLYRPGLTETADGRWALSRLESATGYLKTEEDAAVPQRLRSDIVVILGTDTQEKLSLHPNRR